MKECEPTQIPHVFATCSQSFCDNTHMSAASMLAALCALYALSMGVKMINLARMGNTRVRR